MTMMSVLTLVSGKEDRTLRRIRVSEIARNPNQPRKYFDPEAIAQLAESIRQYGVLVPAIVREDKVQGNYEIIAGHRRKRACELVGLPEMPAIVRDLTDDEAVLIMVDSVRP